MANKGSLFIISAPSGAGKTSLVKALVKSLPRIAVSISYTTRPMRPQEQEGTDYHFVDHADFKDMLKKETFLEHAQVFGHFYGTSRIWVEETRNKGIDVILEIDWQGARQVRTQFLEAQSVFILPPSTEALLERLQKRHSENAVIVAERMNNAKAEISRYNEYDYLVCNDQFEDALEDIKAIIQCHRLQWRRQQVQQSTLIEKLLS
jgi:guanylate kinase